MYLSIKNVLLKSFFVFIILIKIGNVISKINDTKQLELNSSLDSLNVSLINSKIKNQFIKENFLLKNEKNSKLIKTDKKNVSENNNQNHKEITEKTIKINLALNTDMKFKNNSDRQFPIVKNTDKKKSINVSLMLNSNFTIKKKDIFRNVSSSPFSILSLTPSLANLSKTVSVSSIKNFNKTSYQQIFNNKKEFTSSYTNITKQNNSEILHPEKVLVYPVQIIASNEQSQSKRAPHYLEEKFRIQPEKLSSTTPQPIRPSLIIDTQPLIEEMDSELNIKELNERLMSEEELLHQNTNVAGISNEESSFEIPLNTNHHLSQNDLEKIDKSWIEKNCLKNCSCSFAIKWPEISYQYRNTLNCSNNNFSSFPIINLNLIKFTERLVMSKNNLQSLLVDEQNLNCERLIELDLSNNQLKNIVDISNIYKNFQHPIVEFHPFHHHFPKEENNKNINFKNLTKFNSGLKIMKHENLTSIKHNNTNNNATLINSNATRLQNKKNFIHKQHFFSICHRLKVLDLSKNNFDVLITGSFRGLKKLRKLFLDECQIRYIEKNAFLGANDLRLLSLRFNSLSSVHSDMFQHMINLKVLDLTGNSLTYLGAGIFNSLVALQALHLGQNKLRQLSFQCFSGLDGLQLLTLNSNSLNTIPRFALQPLKKLKILDMSVNPIKQILEDDFSHSFVQLLLLNNLNELQHVARFAFWDLPYLNELQISHCFKFIHLDEQAIVGAPALRRLKLENNAITRLDDRLLENLARMTLTSRHQLKVFLAGNPFVCDCFFKPVYLCALDQTKCKIKIPDNKNITCSIDLSSNNEKNKSEYKIEELKVNQLPNECVPSFVPIITPINITIIRRLRSKFFLSCKAQGSPTPNVFWLQPNGEIHKEKLMTRHGHDLMESDLLTLPHAFRNDESHIKDQYSFIEHKENLSQLGNINQVTSGNGISVTNSISSAHHGSSTLRVGHLTPNDAGLYTCVAENRLGSIKSHIQLITQQLKVYLTAENISINYITINWQVDSIFNPPLNETFKNLSNESNYFKTQNLDLIKELEISKNEKNSNFLDYQLFYKIDSLVTNEDKQQINSETLGLEKIYDTNKFFASYESVLLNRKLKNFTISGLRSGTRYKVCIAVKEPKNNELEIHNDEFFKKRSIYQERRIFRLKRNLISIESANYLAIGCLHAQTSHAAFYARNILRVEELHFPNLLSKTFKTTIKLSSLSMLLIIFVVLIVTIYNWTKKKQRRSAYETPRKTLLSLANNLQHQNSNNNTPFNTPSNNNSTSNPSLQMKNIYSPLMMARCNQ